MEKGDIVKRVNTNPEQHFTQPPARYSEATLIKTLEENGVGRPSTYAPTIETIQKRYYVKLVSKRFEPTELGEIVNSLIVEFFPDIVNVKFTADMEAKLDDVEVGKEQWQKVIDEFYKPFEKEVAKAETEMEKFKSKMNLLDLTVKSVEVLWLSNWAAMVNSMHVAIFLTVVILKRLSKKSV